MTRLWRQDKGDIFCAFNVWFMFALMTAVLYGISYHTDCIIMAPHSTLNPSNVIKNIFSLLWRHNERDGVSNHQRNHYLLNCWFGCRSKKTSKLRVTGLCLGNSPVAGEFPAQKTSYAENVSIWWRHHVTYYYIQCCRKYQGPQSINDLVEGWPMFKIRHKFHIRLLMVWHLYVL